MATAKKRASDKARKKRRARRQVDPRSNLAQRIARLAWRDPTFRAALQKDAKGAIEARLGVRFPDGATVTAHFNDAKDLHFVVPFNPNASAPKKPPLVGCDDQEETDCEDDTQCQEYGSVGSVDDTDCDGCNDDTESVDCEETESADCEETESADCEETESPECEVSAPRRNA